MTTAVLDRQALKAACIEMLDRCAVEHPAGHQGKLAARYVLRNTQGDRIELMFEKGEKTPPHLWIEKCFGAGLSDTDIVSRDYPASALFMSAEPDAKPTYGRHAALKPMRALAHADLVRLTIDRTSQMEAVLAQLQS